MTKIMVLDFFSVIENILIVDIYIIFVYILIICNK